ncbi:MAG: type I restriction-modification enzyme R subunit C-terminal domain-containing protein [Verrucomicrobiae bacterium]|nr:type I restriction-modification enzyme R subunit C-terminal domain-containing protein [Verrucomicrobiae bacterium]
MATTLLLSHRLATFGLGIETDDFDYAPFSQRGGLGKAHQLFGKQLTKLFNEFNEVLAA